MTVFRLGLTGSIGMGKSTTAKLFVAAGCAVWDADAAVHRLYSVGGAAVDPMQYMFPRSIINGAVSRDVLKELIATDAGVLKKIEAIVHPLLVGDRAAFGETAEADILVYDIPLLYETGGEARMDAVAVVSVDAGEQRRRVLARGTMTEAQFEAIKAKQMPDADKRARADYVIATNSLEKAATQVQDIIEDIRRQMADA